MGSRQLRIDLRAVGVPGDRAGNRLAVADAGGLDRSPADALPLKPRFHMFSSAFLRFLYIFIRYQPFLYVFI